MKKLFTKKQKEIKDKLETVAAFLLIELMSNVTYYTVNNQ